MGLLLWWYSPSLSAASQHMPIHLSNNRKEARPATPAAAAAAAASAASAFLSAASSRAAGAASAFPAAGALGAAAAAALRMPTQHRLFGEGGQKRDARKAEALLQSLIKENRTDYVAAQALCELGDLLLMGMPGLFRVQRDVGAAVEHLADSAALGYGPALHALGFAAAVGLGGVQRDDSKALQLHYLAALTGFIPSVLVLAFRSAAAVALVLAFRLLYGDGLQADCWAALGLYKQAAAAAAEQQQQHPLVPLLALPPSARLSPLTRTEMRQERNAQRQQRDPLKAEMYFTKAALQEHPEAFYFLGEIRQQQAAAAAAETEKQKARFEASLSAEALRFYGKAAEGGYHLGWLREAELLEAQANQRRSLPEGSSSCIQSSSGVRQQRGYSLQLYYEKDYEGALLLNLAAAEEGLEVAQWNAAFLLQSGAAAVPAAAAVAAAALAAAAKDDGLRQQQAKPQWSPPAAAADAVSQQQPTQQKDEQQQQQQQQLSLVYRQLNRAALQGNVQALREIGLLHANGGEGAFKDQQLATQVLLRTFSLGDIHAAAAAAFLLCCVCSALQRAEDMLQYFLESGGPQEVEGAPVEAPEGVRRGSWFKGMLQAAVCKAAIWRIRLKRRLKTQQRFF
ncbi:hypothetical protein Esti_001821 [Eimeria stiedai]